MIKFYMSIIRKEKVTRPYEFIHLCTFIKFIILPLIICSCKRRGEEFKSLQETTFQIGLFCMNLNSNHAQNTLSG